MQRCLIRPPVTQANLGPEESAGDGWSIANLITPSRRLSPEQRLAVYHNAYFARLLECLRLEFPAVRHAAGDAFDSLAVGYLQAHPSRSHTLNDLGGEFSAYLRATRPPKEPDSDQADFADFLIDLARLERTYSEVFDAPGPECEPLSTSGPLSRMSPDQFADSRLMFYDTVRLLALRFPCHDYASAVRQRREIAPPRAAATQLVVFRRSYTVRRMVQTPLQFAALTALWEGTTVQQALQRALTSAEGELPPEAVTRMFQEWMAAPLIREVIPA